MGSGINLGNYNYNGGGETKQRIVQELVPGKQITLAHIIANPNAALFEKLAISPVGDMGNTLGSVKNGSIEYNLKADQPKSAIGIMTVSPAETAIIMADIAVKAAGAQLSFVNWVSGSLIINGSVSEVEAAIKAILEYVQDTLGYAVCVVTKT